MSQLPKGMARTIESPVVNNLDDVTATASAPTKPASFALGELSQRLTRGKAVVVFLVFAFAYFLSTLIRAITATLAPTLTAELHLQASDLGLLAGAYFLGFSIMQLPLGTWLDRHGPKRVILSFLSVAVLSCVAFALTQSFTGLLIARVLCGAGVSACLMAPLTGYRRWLDTGAQLRANSWMLMTGALGMLASTLPVQWLMPITGWRGIFALLALGVVLAMVAIAVVAPPWRAGTAAMQPSAAPMTRDSPPSAPVGTVPLNYGHILRHPYFLRLLPQGLFIYGGMVAVQTLWAGPWMVRVAHYSPAKATLGLFSINLCMLISYWLWGWVTPHLARLGWTADKLMRLGLPLSFLMLGVMCWTGNASWANPVVLIALYCMGCSFSSLSQPALALVFPASVAGRVLSAFNLVIFIGVFLVQWGIGLGVDAFQRASWSEAAAFQGAFGVFWVLSVLSYLWFVWYDPKADDLRAK